MKPVLLVCVLALLFFMAIVGMIVLSLVDLSGDYFPFVLVVVAGMFGLLLFVFLIGLLGAKGR